MFKDGISLESETSNLESNYCLYGLYFVSLSLYVS